VPATGGHVFLYTYFGPAAAGCRYNPARSHRTGGTLSQSDKKRRAAERALEYIEPGAILGVGTGSTVNHLIDALTDIAPRLSAVVASSRATEARLRARGLEVSELEQTGDLDLYIDGADEANKHFHLIKGGGGALTREKILAAAARRFVCIIDDSKWVATLGSFPLPVEVIPMAADFVSRQFVRARGRPVLREDYRTDNGNCVIDVHDLRITNPLEMEQRFNQLPGVVTVGIFAQRPADVIVMATDNEIREMNRV
jgi:ribose 5-phosphate isomerase A